MPAQRRSGPQCQADRLHAACARVFTLADHPVGAQRRETSNADIGARATLPASASRRLRGDCGIYRAERVRLGVDMTLTMAAVLSLAAQCAPGVAPDTIASIAMAESGLNPLAIHDNTVQRTVQIDDPSDAI